MSSHDAALKALTAALPETVVVTDAESLYRASFDNLRVSRMPSAVIRPRAEEDIGTVLRLANEQGVPVTARGAGSATTGAASPMPGGWVLDLSGWKQLHIDAESMIAYAQPGVTVDELDRAARAEGLFYPPDPGSKRFATIGGTLACNAGGLRGAKYGVTRDYVYGLEGFMASGAFVRWGLDVKKYVSGYNIRDLWIGSEGTLGIITGAVLKLLPAPRAQTTVLARFPDEATALDTVHAILRARLLPSILEFLDRQTVECFRRRKVERGDLDPWLERFVDGALLLIEVDGHPAEVEENGQQLETILREAGARFERATDFDAAERLWTVRRGCSHAMFALGDTKINEDIVVPLRSQHALLELIAEMQDEMGLPMPTFGHAADGNFHVHIMYHRDNPEESQRAQEGIETLMARVVEMGGAITGEHGIGLAKTHFLHLQHTPEEIQIMRALKETFDPNGVLNPEKLFTPFKPWDYPREMVRMPWDH